MIAMMTRHFPRGLAPSCFLLFLFCAPIFASRLASPITNRPDPFGPLPATTTNIYWINRAGNLDYVDIVYKNTAIQHRLVNQNATAGAGLLRVLDTWNGQDDNAVNLPTGTYDSRIKVNRIAVFDRKIPASGSYAEFNEPRDLACDRYGNVYVLDPSLNTIQKLASDGTLVWKWTIPAGAGLTFPDTVTGGIAVDTNLRVFVSGQGAAGRARVAMMDQSGAFISNRDSSANQDDDFGGMGYSEEYNRLFTASQANLNPYGFSSGGLTLWFRNTSAPVEMLDFEVINTAVNDWIYGVNNTDIYRWRMTTGAPPNCFIDNEAPLLSAGVSPADTRSITQRSNKYLYVVSRGTHQIRQFSTNLTILETRSGFGYGNTNLWSPSGIAWDKVNDLIWVADTSNQRLVCYKESAAGSLQFVRTVETSPYIMRTPLDIALDKDGNSYVVDNGTCLAKKFDEFGNILLTFGGRGDGNGLFRNPQGIAVDEDGFIYISDYGTANGADTEDCIEKFSPSGAYLASWDIIDPRGMTSFLRNGTNFIAVTYQPIAGAAREYGARVYLQNGTVFQSFQANNNQRNYLDIEVDYAGNFYAVDNFRADQIDHYPAGSTGATTPDQIAIGGGRSGLGIDPYGTLWIPNTTSDAIEARQGWAVGGGLAAPLLYQFGSLGTGNGQFTDPNYCTIRMRDQTGRWADLLVVDSGNSRLQKFVINWSNEISEPVTIANPGAPAVTAGYPDPASSTNVVYDGGTGDYYSRSGKSVFKIFFSQNMNTNIKPVVQFITFDNAAYDIRSTSYIGNVWIGTARVPTGHDGPADIRVENAFNLSSSNIRPNPTVLADAFVIDTIPPSLSLINPVSGTVSVMTNLLVDGNTESVIRVDLFNWSSSSGGTLISSVSNVLSDGSGYFMVNELRLKTPKDSTNYITARARDKAGNWSAEYSPRRLVRCIDAIGYAYLEPATNRRLGETGNPGIVFTWQANAIMNNTTVTVDVPSGWSVPSTNKASPGYVRRIESSGLTFVTGKTLWTGNATYPGRFKVNISSVANGGYFKILYGTNALTMISNSPSTAIGLNEWIAKSTNSTVQFTNLWEPPRKVGEASGKSMKIPVIGKPVVVWTSNQMASFTYRGASGVSAFSLFFVNSNYYHPDYIDSIVLTVQNAALQDVNANSRLSSVSIYTGGVLLSTVPAPASALMTIDLTAIPILVPFRGTNSLQIRMNISPSTSSTDVRFKIAANSAFSAKNLQNLAGTAIGVSGTFPWTSGYCRIRTNNAATRIFSRLTNTLPSVIESGQSGLTAFRLVLASTNLNVNDTEITRILINCEDRNANGLIPDTFIDRIVLQRVNNGAIYIQKTPLETAGNTIVLTPSGLYIPNRSSVTCDVKIDIKTNASATNIRFAFNNATNIRARDEILFSSVTNFPSPGYPYPQRTPDAWVLRYFKIEHDTQGLVNTWEKIVFKALNWNRSLLTNFRGTVTLDTVNGNVNTIDWTNQFSFSGVFFNPGAGTDKARYTFGTGDHGVITLSIRDTVSETLTIAIRDNLLSSRSNNLRISPDQTPPSVPVLILPSNNKITNGTSVSLLWQKSSDTGTGVTNYQVFTNGVLAATVSWNITNWQAGPTIREGIHTWRVKPYDRAGNTNVSLTWTFTVDRTVPASPTLVSPSSNSTIGVRAPLFIWLKSTDSISGVSNYLVQVSSNNFIGTQRTYTASGGSATNWTVSPNLSDGGWAWRVFSVDRARNISLPGPVWPLFIDATFKISLKKTVYVTNSPSYAALGANVHNFVPGALCVYTITYTNLSMARGTNVILRDSIPTNLAYIANTAVLNAVPQIDVIDGDKTDFNITLPNTVTCTLKSVVGRAKGALVYRVLVK